MLPPEEETLQDQNNDQYPVVKSLYEKLHQKNRKGGLVNLTL